MPDIAPETKIIFITAYDQYAVRAFMINALDYIFKIWSPGRAAGGKNYKVKLGVAQK